jgi:putative FmdB family regulatory protein
MASYDHRCSPCGITVTVHRPIAERNDELRCTQCDQLMRRVYSGHAVIRVHNPKTR